MELITNIKVFIWALEATSCFFFALFSLIIRYQSRHRKTAMFLMEFAAFCMLTADLTAYAFNGSLTAAGLFLTRLSNFTVYCCLYLVLIGYSYYLCTFIAGRDNAVPKRLLIAIRLCAAGIVLLIIAHFTGAYYTFGTDNVYRRGPLFPASYIVPLAVYVIVISVLVKYKKVFPKLIFASLLFFVILPFAASVAQGLFFGFSVFDASIGLAAIVMFALSLMDQNNLLLKAASEEKMTGLPNSYGLIAEMHRKIAAKTIARYNAFYFDIVRMGLINRKYGNRVGDEVIICYANEIRHRMQDDEVLGRLGGNYFVALVRKENTEAFLNFISGVPVTVETAEGQKTITIAAVAGVYEIDDASGKAVTPEMILSNISLAVNAAKNVLKKPYVFLTPELKQQLDEQRQLMELIPKSMAKREFKAYYQPKVNSVTHLLVGAEALVNWQHDGAFIAPGRFVPLMEQNESICAFDFYMLDYVCGDLREWLDEGMDPPTVSINFSRKNLSNPILAEEIYNVVKRHNVPPHLVQIEITETVDEHPMEDLKGVVEALQRYGMSAAIDDFGTGSSSIKLLKEVPFDVIKIDKAFTNATSERDLKILGYIIAMAEAIHTHVLAEGAEQEEQIEILKDLGCTEIQGYFFDKPLPKEQFEKRIQNPDYGNR